MISSIDNSLEDRYLKKAGNQNNDIRKNKR